MPLARLFFFASLLLLPRLILEGSAAEPAAPSPDFSARLDQAYQALTRLVLDNGMTVLIQEDHSAPLVSIQIWVGAGSVHEDSCLGGGLSHFIEHMIFKGTPTRKPGDMSKAIDDAGGSINAYTSLDRTVFLVDLPAAHWTNGLAILADAVMNAAFPEDEWQREKDVIRREMAMNRDDPARVIDRAFWQAAFTVHPYRVPVIGYDEVFSGMNREHLLSFFKRQYTPDNMIVAIAGDVEAAQVEAAVRAQFAGFTRRARAPVVLPREPDQIAPRFLRQAGPYNVARLEMGWHAVSLQHPDAPVLDLLATVVGSGRSSRLVREIKETRKLAHSIDAWSYTPKDPGVWGISAVFDPAREAELTAAIEGEVARWQATPFAAEEIEKARRMVLTATLAELATMHGQAGALASGEFYAADARFSKTYLRRIADVTADALLRVARQYLRPENRTLVVLTTPQAPPVTAPKAAVVVPEIRPVSLPGNVPLLVREDHRLPFVDVCVALTGGLLFESQTNNGISTLMSELLTRGTERHSASQIAERVEARGATLTAFSGYNSFGLRAHGLTPDAGMLIDLLSECLLSPAFPEEEVEKQRAVQLAAIAQRQESPMFIAQEALRQALFPGHPYRFTLEGTPASVAGLSRATLKDYHRKMVVGGNLVVAIFGDITPDEAAVMTSRCLTPPAGIRPAIETSTPKPRLPAESRKEEPREQAIVILGFPGLDLKDPRMDATAVIEEALNGLSSDLMIEIRDKRGLAYFSGASHRPGLDPGMFALYAGTREPVLAQVLDLMRKELTRLVEQGLRPEELARAKAQIIAQHQRGLQDNAGLAMECALNELYGLGYDYGFKKEARVQALTAEGIRTVAAALFAPARMATSIVIPDASTRKP